MIMTIKKVIAETGLSRSSVYRMTLAGDFPAPIALGCSRRVGYRREEVKAWVDSRERVSMPRTVWVPKAAA